MTTVQQPFNLLLMTGQTTTKPWKLKAEKVVGIGSLVAALPGAWRSTVSAGAVGRMLFVGCLMSQQQASVSQGRICSDNFTCCHTEIEVVDQTFYLTQSQYTDTRADQSQC